MQEYSRSFICVTNCFINIAYFGNLDNLIFFLLPFSLFPEPCKNCMAFEIWLKSNKQFVAKYWKLDIEAPISL